MRKNFIIDITYFSIIFALVFLSIKYILPIIYPVILGFFIIVILNPIAVFFTKSLNISKKKLLFLCTIFFYIAFISAFIIIFSNIFFEIKNLSSKIPNFTSLTHYFLNIKNIISAFFQNHGVPSNILYFLDVILEHTSTILAEISLFFAKIISDIVKSLPIIFINFILTILSSFLAVFEYDFLCNLCKKQHFPIIQDIKNCISDTFYTFFTSYAVILSVTFLELAIGFFIAGVDNFIKLAFIIALFDIIPAIGTGFFLIPWIIFEFLSKNTAKSLILLILYLFCLIMRNILEPKLLSDKNGINPILTIICIILGAKFFGVIGAIIAPFSLIVVKKLKILGYFS